MSPVVAGWTGSGPVAEHWGMRSSPAPWFVRPGARDWRCEPPPVAARRFHVDLPGYRPTPLVDLPALAEELGVGRVLVKDESSRLGLPAFKVLGASWGIACELARRAGLPGPVGLDRLREVVAADPVMLVTATDGNHGRAVARMASLLGAPAHIVVPEVLSAASADAIAAEGAAVERIAGDYDGAVRHAAGLTAGRADAVLIQDVAWPGYERVPGWIVQGYATLMLEVDAALPALGIDGPDLVVVPVGVGSLAQAVIAHCRSRTGGAAVRHCRSRTGGAAVRHCRSRTGGAAVLGVEPEAAACVLASLRADRLRTVSTGETVMVGLVCGTPSSAAWPYLRAGLDAATAVGDAEATGAVADLAALGVSSGPSGAAALAGARAALTGPYARSRRADLGVDGDSVVVLLSTEGRGSGS